MHIIPEIQYFKDRDTLTRSELTTIVSLMIFLTICFISELALALTNTWKFLIKQKKYKNWPLLMFYLFTIVLAAMRIYSSYFMFHIIVEQSLFAILLTVNLKLSIGIIQCWVLIELALKVTQNIRLTKIVEKDESSESSPSQGVGRGNQRIENVIKYGQSIVLCLITVELVAFMVYLSVKSVELDTDERNKLANLWVDTFGWCFFTLSFALFASVYYLINRLRKMRD